MTVRDRLPCAHCSGDSRFGDCEVTEDGVTKDKTYIYCINCGMQTPTCDTEDEALNIWNRRSF